jgi:hypothetical protein
MKERESIYALADFTEEDGMKAAELKENLVKWVVIMLRVMQQLC